MSRNEKNKDDRILLEGMVFYGRHGTLPAERELGQPFVVDVELFLELRPAGLSDDLARTVDYGEVHRRAREIVEGPPANLHETVGGRKAAGVVGEFPAVEAGRGEDGKTHVRPHDNLLPGS